MKNSNLKTATNLLSEDLQHVELEDVLYAVKEKQSSLNYANFETLMSSKEFTNIVNELTNLYRISYNNDIKNDIRQACAIATWESFNTFIPEKTNGNFWGYAYPRMKTYAKRESYNQKNIVHIPENRIENKKYEQVSLTYEDITYDDGHDKSYGVEKDTTEKLEVNDIINLLDVESQYIFKVHSDMEKGKNGKSDFRGIGECLGRTPLYVKKRYIEAQKKLAAAIK